MAVDLASIDFEQLEVDPTPLLEKVGALLHGEYKLASGRKSDYYIDSKKLTLNAEGALFVAERIVRKLDQLGIRYVGGTAYSAIPIVSHVALFSGIRDGSAISAFYHRKEAKGHGTNARAEGQLPPSGDIQVAIVEDVVTTGDSLLEAIRRAKDDGYHVVQAITLVDRNEGGREKVEKAGYPFWSLLRAQRMDGKVYFVCNNE
jgi:orotate phosphoribosyltransferase